MGKIKALMMDLEDLVFEAYTLGLHNDEVREYTKSNACYYDEAFVTSCIQNMEYTNGKNNTHKP